MYVSCVNVMKPFRACDLASARERGRWRVRFIEHFEIGMEGREVPWHISAEILCEPFRSAMQFVIAVVFARNEQRCDFKPDVRFVSEIFQCVEHRLKLGKTKPMVKRIGERFQ